MYKYSMDRDGVYLDKNGNFFNKYDIYKLLENIRDSAYKGEYLTIINFCDEILKEYTNTNEQKTTLK